MKNKSYIGDGVYIHIDGPNIWLEAGGPANDRNRIAINEDNWHAFCQWMAKHAPPMYGNVVIIELPDAEKIQAGFRKLQDDLDELEASTKPVH